MSELVCPPVTLADNILPPPRREGGSSHQGQLQVPATTWSHAGPLDQAPLEGAGMKMGAGSPLPTSVLFA